MIFAVRICILILFCCSFIDLNSTVCQLNAFNMCYSNNIENRSIFVWFTIEKSLNQTFDFYRFVQREDNSIQHLTNFTSLIDRNNSLRMLNIDTGEYEICIEFQSISLMFIYQPRDGCLRISIGKSTFESFHQNSISLLVTLASVIVLFFLLGLIVQWVKGKRQRQDQYSLDRKHERSSSFMSNLSLRQQRERVLGHFFHRCFDQSKTTHLHQWARHRPSIDLVSSRKVSFDLA